MTQRRLGRNRELALEEREEIYAVLDQGVVAHIGFVDPDTHEPVVIPVAYARDGDRLLFHGSTGSRMFIALKSGTPVCATVTILDGLVVARSAFNSSMNYRSVMAFGIPRAIEGDAKAVALQKVTEHLIPGLSEFARPSTTKEYAQTMVIELILDDVTAKRRQGGSDDPEDAGLPIWAGHLPVSMTMGAPITNDDARHVAVPEFVQKLEGRVT